MAAISTSRFLAEMRSLLLVLFLWCQVPSECIECFFQPRMSRDHFCTIFHSPDHNLPQHLIEHESDNSSQHLHHLTVMSTENIFLGETSPGAPNCTTILERSVDEAAGLVNYRCAPAKMWMRAGLKCCSFGEKYTEAAHRHAHSQLARQIVRPAQRQLMNRCAVTMDDEGDRINLNITVNQ